MSKLKCVIQYKHLGDTNETALNEVTFEKLQDSKQTRRILGGEDIHKEQIDNWPNSLGSETHGFHRQCYQKFTNALLKQKKSLKNVPDKRQLRSHPKNISTICACESIQRTAILQKHEKLLLLAAKEDLTARELKMHKKCYRDYTRMRSKQNVTVGSNCS